MGFFSSLFGKKKDKVVLNVTMETTVNGEVVEEPDDYFHEIDDGFESYKVGEEEKKSITISDGVADIRKVRTGTIETDCPCGFDFENVIVFDCSYTDVDTGEVAHQSISVWPRGGNAEKLVRDTRMLVDMAKGSADDVFRWSDEKAQRLVDCCQEDISHVDDEEFHRERRVYYHMNLRACPFTPTGKRKKFPVEGVLLYEGKWAGKGNIQATMSYFPSGSVGKARLIVNGMAINFAMVDGELAIKKKEKIY